MFEKGDFVFIIVFYVLLFSFLLPLIFLLDLGVGITETENGAEIQNPIQMPQLPISGICSSDGSNRSLFASLYTSPAAQSRTSSFSDLIVSMTRPDRATTAAPPSSTEPPSLCLSSNGPTLFSPPDRRQFAQPQPPHMSATALLQKAAQMGAAATSSSLFRGFGPGLSSPLTAPENLQWDHSDPSSGGLGIEHPGLGLSEFMMGQSIFGSKPATLDLLGLGMGIGGGAAAGGLSALITSIGSGLDVAASFGGGNSPGKS